MPIRILINGGYDADADNAGNVAAFAAALGAEVVQQGHILINSANTDFDRDVAEGARNALAELGAVDEAKSLRTYVRAGSEPNHSWGKLFKSRLSTWDPGGGVDFVPEPVQVADVVVLVAGFEGTFRAAHWARYANKPLLPVTYFGGASEKLYETEIDHFDEKYEGWIDRDAYEDLNAYDTNWAERARAVVSLAEDIAASSSVTVMMWYPADVDAKTELENALDSFKQACKKYGYEAEPVTEMTTQDDIVPSIKARIDQSAFVIADLTEVRPNVMYELGYAHGLRKPFIVTAKEGTHLPFDVKDVPVIFWNPVNQKELREKVAKKVAKIAEDQGWNPGSG